MSRVHELGRMNLDELLNILSQLHRKARRSGWEKIPRGGWDKDRVITRIREMEDPK